MIKLECLEMHNFFSHKSTVLDLTSYDGLTLIEGKTKDGHYSSNGSGKSTILEGIYYALTGKTLRGLTADAVVNTKHGRDTVVLLTFKLGCDRYEIARYRKHTQFQNDLVILKNGNENLSGRTLTDTQKVIDEIVNLPNDILSGVMILGEGLSSRFTQLSDPAKKGLLENTIRLSHNIDRAREVTKSRLSSASSRIQYLRGSIDSNERLLEEYKTVSESDTTGLESDLEEANRQYTELWKKSQDLSTEDATITHKVNVLLGSIRDHDQISSEISKLSNEVERSKEDLGHVDREVPVCPLCQQHLTDPTVVRGQINAKIRSLLDNISTREEERARLPDREIVTTKIDELSSRGNEIKQQIVQTNESLRSISERVPSITARITAIKERSRLISETEEKIRVSSEELTSLLKEESLLLYLEKNVYSPTGVIVDILTSVVQYIDQRLQVYNTLLQDKVFHLTFKKNKIAIEGSGSTYQSLSNGEKRRLDISIQFALHDYIYTHCGIGFDTLFIDEVLDTLDSVGVSNILEVLSMKKSYCSLSRVFVVTHNEELKEYFDSVLSVSKGTDGYTYVV